MKTVQIDIQEVVNGQELPVDVAILPDESVVFYDDRGLVGVRTKGSGLLGGDAARSVAKFLGIQEKINTRSKHFALIGEKL